MHRLKDGRVLVQWQLAQRDQPRDGLVHAGVTCGLGLGEGPFCVHELIVPYLC
jgi:hypothetical protein